MTNPKFEAVDFDPFASAELVNTGASTEAQRELWTASQLGSDASCAFNESVTIVLDGGLDMEALNLALSDLTQRHEALRMTFTPDGASFVVAQSVISAPRRVDLSTHSPTERDAALGRLKVEEVETAFDLGAGPLVRFVLAKLTPERHALIMTAHHVICDGWSIAVMLQDLGKLYTARKQKVDFNAPSQRFSDYAKAQAEYERSADSAADESFWLKQFATQPDPLELPTDRPRPKLKTFASRRIDHDLDATLVESVKKLGAKSSTSFFTTLLAGFGAMLHRLTHQDEVVIAIPSAGQSATGMRDVVGHCVNALPLRFATSRNEPAATLLSRVRGVMLDAVEHQRFTFGTLVKKLGVTRDPSRLPLVSVIFNLDQAVDGGKLGFEGLQASFSSNPRHYENFEIFINAAEHRGVVTLECQYNTDLFDDATMRLWLAGYERFLRDWVAHPERTVGMLDIGATFTRDETTVAYPTGLAHDLVYAQAAKTPDAIALSQGDAKLTYKQLIDKVDALADALVAAGVTDDTVVGIYLHRTLEMPAAVYAVHAAGGAYLPMDPMFPRERLEFYLSDSKAPVVITESSLADTFAATGVKQILVDKLDKAPPRAKRPANPQALAYVLYTSGSTGKPKGVAVQHFSLVNLIASFQKAPGLSPSDKLLAITTLSFDIACLEMYLPVTTGACMVIATKEQVLDPAELIRVIKRDGVTALQATPATWRMLVQAGLNEPGLKCITGGEALTTAFGRDLVSRVKELWNGYGPTETTIYSTRWKVPPQPTYIRIGEPIDNTRLYVLDPDRQPVLMGTVGELYIAGDGVAREYLGRPDLTSERFIEVNGERAYRTGDLVRRHRDGQIEYIGRADFQVKLRGFRIELGEIESTLRLHPDIDDAVAAVREDRVGDPRLVVYLISKREVSLDELRAHLGKTMPEYMQPSVYVRLETFPLTPNNKVDRKRLPAPSGPQPSAREYVEPSTDLERQVATIFGDVLGMTKVSADDNFFHLGGHSLLAAHVVSRLARDLKIAVPMRRIFESPSVQKLAAALESTKGTTATVTPIKRGDRQDLVPATMMQTRILFGEQMDPGITIYNVPSSFRIKGKFDIAAMKTALQMLVDRHSTLRTTLFWDGAVAMQRVADSVQLDVPVEDLSAMAHADRESKMLAEMQALANVPFDTSKLPLAVAKMYKLASDEHVLFWMVHHAIWDGWSFDIFLDELDKAYTSVITNTPPTYPALPVTYADFSRWQAERLRGDELAKQTEYWKKLLKAPLPVLELATDKPRPARYDFEGRTEAFRWSAEEVEKLTQLARQHDATLYMTLLAGFSVLLHRLTEGEDIIVGTPVRGRALPEIDHLLGFFVNTLALRVDLSGQPTFAEVLKRVRTLVLDAFTNQEVPFDALVREMRLDPDPSRTPVYQSFFIFQDVRNRGASFGGTPYGQIHVHSHASHTDVTFWVKQLDDGIVGGVDYAYHLFESSTLKRMLEELRTLLASAAENPNQPIAKLNILPAAERGELQRFNATTEDFPKVEAHQLVHEQARRTPDAIAITQGDNKLTYAQLVEHVKKLADVLTAAGVKSETLVGIHLNRTIEMVVAILAVHEAGGAYVPLDPAFPAERLQFMLEDSKAPVVITETELEGTFAKTGVKQILVDKLETVPAANRVPRNRPESLAYVLYTSGSTGKPKGVAVPHRALVNFLNTMKKTPGFSSTDRLLAVTTLSFDIAGLELFLPLTVGGRIVLATRDQASDGAELARLIKEEGVTIMQATPSTWRLLLQTGFSSQSFKALCGGEALPPELGRELAGKVGELWNMYGPTETTIWSTCSRVMPGAERMSIGKPIGNTTCFVVDSKRELTPIGVIGELYIGGDGVAREYLNRPDLTAERFVTIEGARAYRTGDLVRWEANGELTYMRRNDTQVKVRGYRIELGEIESALRAHAAIEDAVVSVREDHPGDVRLVGYVIHKQGSDVTDSEMRKHLRLTLPDYMVPQIFVPIDRFPLTPNGKVDRKRLPAPFASSAVEVEVVPPSSVSEKLVAAAYAEVLNNPRIGLHDNFFELGGHSLLCLNVIARLEKETGKRLSPRVVLRDSLQQVAAALDGMAAESVTERPEPNVARKGLFGKLFGR